MPGAASPSSPPSPTASGQGTPRRGSRRSISAGRCGPTVSWPRQSQAIGEVHPGAGTGKRFADMQEDRLSGQAQRALGVKIQWIGDRRASDQTSLKNPESMATSSTVRVAGVAAVACASPGRAKVRNGRVL